MTDPHPFESPYAPEVPADPWQPPTPTPEQSPDPGQRTHPLSPLVSSWIAVVAIVLIVGRDILEQGSLESLRRVGNLGIYGIIAGVVLVGSVAVSSLSWFATRYRFDPDGLTIETKLISHETKRLLYRRIQSVEIHQPLAARFLGLCRLSIDVGGEGGGRLSFLTRQQAENLRFDLLQRATRAKQLAQGAPPAEAPAWPPAVASEPPLHGLRDQIMHAGDDLADFEQPRRLVVQVAPRSLVAAALTSGEFLATLIGLAVFALVRAMSGGSVNFGFAFFVIVPVGSYILNRVVKEWRFRVETDGQGLRISHGMTDLATHNTPYDRVQAFSLEQGLLWRPFGWWRVRMTVLGKGHSSEDDDSSTTSVALAIGNWAEAMAVINTVWPGIDVHDIPLNPVPERAKWFLWWGRKAHGWALTDELAISRSGRFKRRLNMADHARAQSIRLHQGPLDRRLNLATVEISLVDGPVHLQFNHLDPIDARRVLMQQPALARAVRARRAQTGLTLSTRREETVNPPPSDLHHPTPLS